MADSLRDALRAPSAPVSLADIDPRGKMLAPGDKESTREQMAADGAELAALQERLYAEGVSGGTRRVLLVLQGMDTSGKGGVIEHVVGAHRRAVRGRIRIRLLHAHELPAIEGGGLAVDLDGHDGHGL